VAALEVLSDTARLDGPSHSSEAYPFQTLPAVVPGIRVLHTYRAGPRPEGWNWALRTVTLAGVHAESHRAVFVLTDGIYGARSGIARERIDIVDYRAHSLTNRVTGEYGVHVAGSDEDGIERFSGEFRDDVSILGRVVHQLGADYWGDEDFAVSPDGRRIVTRAPGRNGLLVANRFGRRERWLLPDHVFVNHPSPSFSDDNRHVALGCADYSTGTSRSGLCVVDARSGAWSMIEMVNPSMPRWRDVDTLDVVTFEPVVEGPGGFEACLQTVARDTGTATRTACWPGWAHGEPLTPVPGRPDTLLLRLDPPALGPVREARLLLIRRRDGAVLAETTLPSRHSILEVLEGPRVLSAHDAEVLLLDFENHTRVSLGAAELGGTLSRVHRQVVDDVEHVYGQITLDENRHRLVELDLRALSGTAAQSRSASRNAATRR